MAQTQSTSSATGGASTEHHKHGIVIAGLDRPALIAEMLNTYPPSDRGFCVRICVLEPDQALADSMSKELIESWGARICLYAGVDCVEDFLRDCSDRLDCWLPRHIVASGQRTVDIAKSVAAGLDVLVKKQAQETLVVRESLENLWDARGYRHWQERFSQVHQGSQEGAQARVLIVTSRYSTFIKHSAEDLAEAFRANGHEARLILEPDNHTNMTPLLCLRAIAEFDPDLIVVINFPRAMHHELFPDGWAHVCWVQDAMGHLFQKQAMMPTPLDFIAGHVYQGAGGLDGYLLGNSLEFPVPVSEKKFTDRPVSEDSVFRCDIAYVSHQSETVDGFYRKFKSQYKEGLWEIIDHCRDEVLEAMGGWQSEPQLMRLSVINENFVERLGRKGDHDLAQLTMSQFVNPLAERMIRHETLEWAGEIAREHGLAMKIYGKGWDQHPTLSSFACGELSHDDELRACYQRAVVHLHASINGCGHQRVFECAQSGGLPLSRRSWDELYMQDWIQINEFMKKNLPKDACLLGWKQPAYSIANFPELQRAIDFRLQLKRPSGGWDHEAFEHVYAEFDTPNVHAVGDVPLQVYAHLPDCEGFSYHDAPIPPSQLRPIETLGDPLDLTFSTKADLEDRILRAVSDKAWRDAESKKLARRVGERVSMSRFAQQLLEMVRNQLAGDQAVGQECAQRGAV